MENNKISFGKRPGNPLFKRVWKDMLRDWKRYLMIGIMLIATIGFVSGMYVANNSMLKALEGNVTALKRENGHFQLSAKADEETLKAIETGEMADVPTVYRERAYSEAADEVEKAVNEAIEDKVAEQVRDAIRAQVTAAVDEQAAAAKALMAEDFLTEAEERILKRARNHRSMSRPQHADPRDYKLATGFEAVIGYLYLSGDIERVRSISAEAVRIIESQIR